MKERLVLVVLLAASLLTLTAEADDLDVRAIGLRGGINVNPDQFNFGVQVDFGRLNPRLRLQPSFEIGLGNGVMLGAANFDAHYLFSPRSFRPYAGGGLGVNFIDVTNGFDQVGGVRIDPVLNLVAGVEWGARRHGSHAYRRYLLEARVGMGDTPDFKLVAGFNF